MFEDTSATDIGTDTVTLFGHKETFCVLKVGHFSQLTVNKSAKLNQSESSTWSKMVLFPIWIILLATE